MICKIIIIIIIIRICCLVVVVANLVWYWWIIIVKWWWWWWKQVHHGLFFLRILSMQKSMKNEKFSLVVLWLCYSHQNSHAKCHPKNFWKKISIKKRQFFLMFSMGDDRLSNVGNPEKKNYVNFDDDSSQ